MSSAPKAFISYAWEGDEHKEWVKEIAVKLRLDYVEVILDQWMLHPGDELSSFMEQSVRESDFVIIICTPTYKAKSDARIGGVGYEGSVITAELVTGSTRRKFIPLLRRGKWTDAAPSWLLGSVYLNFQDEANNLRSVYTELLQTLHRRREGPPPLGSPPFPDHKHNGFRSSERQKANEINKRYTQEAFVLVRLIDNESYDPSVIAQAKAWLHHSGAGDEGWPYVWRALLNAQPGDPEIIAMGKAWLHSSIMGDPAWTHVWNALMDAQPGDPEIIAMGKAWLEAR